METLSQTTDAPNQEFKPGVYQHYRGGLYTAVMLVTHHQTRLPMVVYFSHEKHSLNCRPLVGWRDTGDRGSLRAEEPAIDPDGWNDTVTDLEHQRVPRFRYLGPA